MWIRIIAGIVVVSLLVWWFHPIMVILGVGWLAGLTLLYKGIQRYWKESTASEDLNHKSDKVIDLNTVRQQKQNAQTQSEQTNLQVGNWVSVFETTSMVEADIVASLLESYEIPIHVLNRQSASILIHPIGEFPLKVLVPKEAVSIAEDLLKSNPLPFSPVK